MDVIVDLPGSGEIPKYYGADEFFVTVARAWFNQNYGDFWGITHKVIERIGPEVVELGQEKPTFGIPLLAGI
jgi:hypothetical protein